MTDEKKITTGALNVKALEKDADSYDPIEVINHFLPNYEKDLNKSINKGIKEFPRRNFFLQGCAKSERLLERVLPRVIWNIRETCPVPFFDETVLYYDHTNGEVKELWTLPNMATYNAYITDPLNVDPMEKQLRDYCWDFKDGTLAILASTMNDKR